MVGLLNLNFTPTETFVILTPDVYAAPRVAFPHTR
jgi:hypothetical protein